MNIDHAHYRKLAADLLSDAVSVLRDSPPPAKRPSGMTRTEWNRRWEQWERERMRDLSFFGDPNRSAVWCEAAGVDYDAVVGRLEDEGALYDPRDRFPMDLGGKELAPKTTIRRDRPAKTRKGRSTEKPKPCPRCGLKCRGSGAVALHERSCIGAERAKEAMDLYRDSDVAVEKILAVYEIHPDMFYRLLDSHGIERRQGTGRSPR